MALLSRFRHWLRATFKRTGMESEMDAELRFHLDAYTEDMVRSGVSREEAIRRARIEFGGVEEAKEECREARGLHIVNTFAQDLRFALRMLRKNTGFTVVAVLTLALGIGANTAIFSLINSVMLNSIPVRAPQQLVSLKWSAHKRPQGKHAGYGSFGDCNEQGQIQATGCSFSYPMFRELREKKIFSGVAGFAGPAQLAIAGNGAASIAQAEFVSGDYFQTLGVEAAIGRTLEPTDEIPDQAPVAVLSYGYWQSAFGGSPSVLGKVVRLNGAGVTVVGVADSRFTRLSPGKTEDMWLPLSQAARLRVPWAGNAENRESLWLTIVARLKPDVSAAQSQATVSLLFRNSMLYGPEPLLHDEDDPQVAVLPAQEGLTGVRRELGTPLYLLMAAVGIVFLIACANVGGLLLSRAAGRQREIAVRLALGAGRGRLIRQLLTESIVLAFLGASLGVVIAAWAVQALRGFFLTDPTHLIEVHLDLRVLAFAVCVAAASSMLFGLLPAFRSTRLVIAPVLKQSVGSLLGGSMQSRGGHFRLGNTLVVAQVALSVLVLIFAGLFLRTLTNLKSVNPGFDTANILTFGIDPVQVGYDQSKIQRLYQGFQQRLASIPGVSSVSYSSDVLLSGSLWTGEVRLPRAKENAPIKVQMFAVGPQFFETLRIPILNGRGFNEGDFVSADSVAVVNRAFVRRYLGGRDAVGQYLLEGEGKESKKLRVLGVVADTKYYELRQSEQPTVYVALNNHAAFFSLRTSQGPASAIVAVKQIASEIDNSLPIFGIRTQTEAIDQTLLTERLVAGMSALFGLLAVALASIGLYGLLSYEVARRTRELGIRTALGAQKTDVLRMVVWQGFALTLVGGIVGVAVAAALTRYLASLLYGIKPTDPVTFAAVVLLLAVVAALACAIPARRATTVDPIVALRYE